MSKLTKNINSISRLIVPFSFIFFSTTAALTLLATPTKQINQNNDIVARRLDDIGVNVPKKTISASKVKENIPTLEKETRKIKVANAIKKVSKPSSILGEIDALELKLVNVYNSQKYKESLDSSKFSGTLQIIDGEIASFEISLPDDEELSISYTTLTGNTFSYQIDGENYQGAIFKASANSNNTILISLNGGPFDHTSFKFSDSEPGSEIDLGRKMATQKDDGEDETNDFNFSI